ncbi:MAG TPA: two-component regulator propeller domain-containing protein [Terriglobales bacterium]|nr:two-component regulator propeller domain-containing protein [Terriglobales bacterium]
MTAIAGTQKLAPVTGGALRVTLTNMTVSESLRQARTRIVRARWLRCHLPTMGASLASIAVGQEKWRLAYKGTKNFIAKVIFLLCCSAVFALNPSLDVSQYAHKSWEIREGFFTAPINTVTQTPDGYLWIGTDLGLYRFDGVRSVPWQPRQNKSLPSNIIRKLFVSHDGTLWIGTQKGLASWKERKLNLYPELPAEAVDAIAEDSEGRIWAGVEEAPVRKLCSIKNGDVSCIEDKGTLGMGKGALLCDRKGNLWAGTGTGLWRWRPDSPKSISLPSSASETHALIEGDHGDVLVSTRGGIVSVTGVKSAAYRVPDYDQQFNPFALLLDRDGGLWIGTKDRGLLHVHQGKTDFFDKSGGLSSDRIGDLFEDKEGNIWVGTSSGLDSFHESAVSPMPDSQGFSATSVESVLTARDGTVWFGTRNGLDRWQNGRLTLYRKRRAQLPATVRQIVDPGLPDDFHSALYEDHRGRIWTFSRTGTAYLDERGRFVRVPALPGGYAHSVAEDSEGDLWISEDQGFFHFLRTGKVESIPWAEFGGRSLAPALASDPVGGLWLGFSQGKVAYFKDGQVRHWYSATDGLPEGSVNNLQVDQDGTIWAATEGGLSRFQKGRINTLSTQNGLPCNSVHEFVRDNTQSMWLHTSCGLVRIARSDLESWFVDPRRTIGETVLDASDGPTPLATPGLSPRIGRSRDGKIWFVSGDGISIVDPTHLPLNKLPPPVQIEKIIANGKSYDAANGVYLAVLVRDLTIDYTALSLVVPEKVHFRYKLEGQDKDWREVVNDREVQYSNLPPKSYRFRVIACNNSGVWNEEGATVDFVIPPAWYQTNWFRVLCMGALLAMIWVLHQLRLRQLRKQEEKFREAVETMPALAFVAHADGYRSFVNNGWIEYTGIPLEQALGSGWQAVIHPDDLKRVLDKWRTSLVAGEPFEYEMRLRHSDGIYRWFQTRVVPLRDKPGKDVKWCGLATDIEDRKRSEEQRERLRQLEADLAHINRVSMMGELTASIAHEVNQPLSGVVSNASASLRWLAGDTPNLEEAREAARRIVRDGKRAGEVIARIRALTKKTSTPREKLDLNETLRQVLALVGDEAKRRSVHIRAQFADDLYSVSGDQVQLQQVALNLAMNAIEAMSSVGERARELVITTRNIDADQVHVTVEDSGIGIDPQMIDKIFDSFYTTKPGGMGMGLSISRSILQAHGGRLWATSKNGMGTMFHFTLPKYQEEGSNAGVPAA